MRQFAISTNLGRERKSGVKGCPPPIYEMMCFLSGEGALLLSRRAHYLTCPTPGAPRRAIPPSEHRLSQCSFQACSSLPLLQRRMEGRAATCGSSQGLAAMVAGGDSEHCSKFHSDKVKEWNELHS